jgi:hypothetical protein
MRLEDPRTADEGRSATGEHHLFTRTQQRRLAAYKIKFCCGRLGREFTVGHQQHPPASGRWNCHQLAVRLKAPERKLQGWRRITPYPTRLLDGHDQAPKTRCDPTWATFLASEW